MEVDPRDDQRSASSSWNNDPVGTGHHRGCLSSPQAWSAASKEDPGEWYELDAGGEVFIAGVITKGRADLDQWVTGFKIEVSADRNAWAEVDGGVVFPGNRDRNTAVRAMFRKPVLTRHLRIRPQSANAHMSLRAGLLVQDSARLRPSCFYGDRCKTSNKRHQEQYAHPGDWDYEAVEIKIARDPQASLLGTRLFNIIDVTRSGDLKRHELSMVEGIMAESVKAMFSRFDLNGAGVITKDDLSRVLTSIGIANSEIESIFEAADLNKDGFINFTEFLSWIYSPGASKLPEDLESIPFPTFAEMDANSDGAISKEEWTAKLASIYTSLGKEAFMSWAERQVRFLQKRLAQKGARIFYRGLPEPVDKLQKHALDFVSGMWGADVILRPFCQEYGMRAHARIMHVSGVHEYTPPSTGDLQTFHGGRVMVERVVKIAIENKIADVGKWAIAYHGIDTHAKDRWAASGPNFTGYGGAHGPGIYTTPAFSLAGAYALRRWTGEWRYDDVQPEYCETRPMHFIAVLMCALSDFKKAHNTADRVAASTEGWGRDVTEWVVPGVAGQPVPAAQIYGIIFCYFGDNPRGG